MTVARISGLTLGGIGAGSGLVLVAIAVASTVTERKPDAHFVTRASAMPVGLLLLALGLTAIWLTMRAIRGLPGLPLSLPPLWLSIVVLIVALGGGWAALRSGQRWLFFPFGTLAIVAPATTVAWLGLPAERRWLTWSRILPALAWGAIGAPVVAIVLEGIAAVGAIAALLVGIAFGGQNNLTILRRAWEHLQGRTLTDPQTEALTQLLLRQPLVLLALGSIVVIIAPIIEELSKFGAVLVAGRIRVRDDDRPASVLTLFAIGLAAGLGFAMVENIFYDAEAGATGWTLLALLRAATPLMHGTASALFALGWARQRYAPRGWGLLQGMLGAFGLHSLWNLSGGLIVLASLAAALNGTTQALAGLVILIAGGVLVALTIGSVAILLHQRRALGQETRQAEGSTVGTVGPAIAVAPGME